MPAKPKKQTKQKKQNIFVAIKKRGTDLRARRPHKSFKLTRRRDIPKRPSLPGYFRFTKNVFQILWKFRRHFLFLLLFYVTIATLLIGLVSQEQYRMLTDSLKDFGPALFGGQLDSFTTTLGLFGAAVTGGLNTELGEVQQIYLGLVYLLTWLVTIWLLRHLLAGNAVKVRDALYNGSAPFISTLLVGILMIIQSLPAAVGITVFSLVTRDDSMSGAVAMLFGVGSLLLVVLSLYWLASSFFALLIVTLPGTYPMAAIRTAGDIALGRRLSMMLRLLWLGLIILLIWVVILVPILLIDNWINASWLPLVPLTVQILSGVSLLFVTTYIYLLYREMINEKD